MKNIKYLVFITFLLFINIFHVEASCSKEELLSENEAASEIKITYKHMGKVEKDDEVYYNIFEVKVKNIPDNMYISLFNGMTVFTPINNEVVETFNNGTWIFDIYSNQCEEKISSIKVFIPRFNIYSLDPMCEGIDGDNFPLCGKYYEHDISYEKFKERVNYYRNTQGVNNKKTEEDNYKLTIEHLLNYIIKYRIYIVISLVLILIILISIILSKRRKKRGVLE